MQMRQADHAGRQQGDPDKPKEPVRSYRAQLSEVAGKALNTERIGPIEPTLPLPIEQRNPNQGCGDAHHMADSRHRASLFLPIIRNALAALLANE
jgi:hypothetical protein